MVRAEPEEPNMAEEILRLPLVKQRTGLSRSEIYRRERLGEFPHRISLGARAVGWFSSDIERWVLSRVRQTRAGVGNAGKPQAATQ